MTDAFAQDVLPQLMEAISEGAFEDVFGEAFAGETAEADSNNDPAQRPLAGSVGGEARRVRAHARRGEHADRARPGRARASVVLGQPSA